MRFKSFYGHLVAALAGVAAFHIVWREVVYKLADGVLVHADVTGFVEMSKSRPWGAVDWLVSLLAATNLAEWGIVVQLLLVAIASVLAYLALRRRRSALAPFVPWLAAALFVLPTLSLGEDVWMLRHPQFPQQHLVWFMVLAGCLFAGWKGLAGFVVIPLALVVLGRLCYYDLPADEVLWSAWNLPIQTEWDWRSLAAVLMLLALAVAAFIRGRAPKFAHALVPVLFLVGYFVALPGRDPRTQLQMERAVRASRFADVLEVAPSKAKPERMETAWRILAMFRTDRIDRELFRYPIIGSHHATKEKEMLMGGPLLLFNYGLVLPARRWLFEVASVDGWKPQDFRLLGDIAMVTGEMELARKYFEELDRCPFRGDYAAKSLRALAHKELPETAYANLYEVSAMHDVWVQFSQASIANFYSKFDCDGERFVYELYERLSSCPPKMLKMVFASALLNGHPERLRENRSAMKLLYPDGNIGPVFLEALR